MYTIYSPPPPNVGKTENPPWIFSGVYHDIDPAKVQQRVYVSVKSEHVKTVWNALQGFLCGYGGAWNAKHATDEEAKLWPDTIVIYMKGKKDISIILAFIRSLVYEKTPDKGHVQGGDSTYNQSREGFDWCCFCGSAPGRWSWAAVQKAHHEQSFGMQLAQFATKAYVHVWESKDGDLEKFKARAAKEFHEAQGCSQGYVRCCQVYFVHSSNTTTSQGHDQATKQTAKRATAIRELSIVYSRRLQLLPKVCDHLFPTLAEHASQSTHQIVN